MPFDIAQLHNYRDFALQIAIKAGKIATRYFNSNVDIEYKLDNSPVTKADRQIEAMLRKAINDKYPSHDIIGEELENHPQNLPMDQRKFCWYLDPIDGTQSYAHGIPLYTTLIALFYQSTPLIGIIYCPQTGEWVEAISGNGCHYNGRHCEISSCRDISQARLMTSDVSELLRRLPSAIPLLRSVSIGRTWADGYAYLMLASGRCDIVIDPILNPWDIAPLYPIVMESGGAITSIAGKYEPLGASVLACGRSLHGAAAELLTEHNKNNAMY